MAIRSPIRPQTPQTHRRERTADGSEAKAKGFKRAARARGKKGAAGVDAEGGSAGGIREGRLSPVEDETEEHRRRKEALALIGDDEEVTEIRTLATGAPSLDLIDPEFRGQITQGLTRRQTFCPGTPKDDDGSR